MRKSLMMTALIAMTLIGCAANGNSGAVRSSSAGGTPSNVTSVAETGDFLLSRIGDSALPKGECGMVLWTLEADKPAPILRVLSNGEASLAINQQVQTFYRSAASGFQRFGVSEEQVFHEKTGQFAVRVHVEFGMGFDGGTYLKSGLVTLDHRDGWRTVTPAAGIAGCRQ